MAGKGLDVKDIVALGITNQRETTIVWDKHTGEPLFNALGKENTINFTTTLLPQNYEK